MKNLVTFSSSPARLKAESCAENGFQNLVYTSHLPSSYVLNLKDPAIGLAPLLVSVQVNVCF